MICAATMSNARLAPTERENSNAALPNFMSPTIDHPGTSKPRTTPKTNLTDP
jgi:hypothetical protein